MGMFLVKLKQSITSFELSPDGRPLLLAISGGPDSVALGEGLWRLGYSLQLAHINYQLRGEDSEKEEALVRQYARKWDARCWVKRSDPKAYATKHAVSLQVACRELRYAFFEELLLNQGLKSCLTAHHADDQVETLLMSLIFGNHPEVLRAIPERRGPYLRPMLDIPKAEILAFLKEENLEYGWDVSNDRNEYRRNRIRNQVLPLLEEIQPNFRSQLLQQHHILQEQQAFLDQIIAPFLPPLEEGKLDWQAFVAQLGEASVPVLARKFLQLRGIHGHLREACLKLISAQVGKWVLTPKGKVIRNRSGIEILPQNTSLDPIQVGKEVGKQRIRWAEESWELEFPFKGEVDWTVPDTHYLNADQLHFPIRFRVWRKGDSMQPMGMKTNKKLSDIFVDEKYSHKEKQTAWVLEDQEKIVCLQGFRIAESVKITRQTSQVLRIRKLDVDSLSFPDFSPKLNPEP